MVHDNAPALAESPAGIAKRFNLNRRDISRAIKAGELPVAKFGTRRRVLYSDAVAWFLSNLEPLGVIDMNDPVAQLLANGDGAQERPRRGV
jgi:excisionase family DNA binding protein